MIYGLGTDIVETKRIARMLEKHGKIFTQKVFTDAEISQGEKRKDQAQYYAGRWAAKEALAKALGCGIGEQCAWLDISVKTDANGAPSINIAENVLLRAGLTKADSVHLSISHEEDYASATVIIEKV